MTGLFDASDQADVQNGSSQTGPGTKSVTLGNLFIVCAWSGLVAGLFEVAAIIVRKEAFDSNHIYGLSRHFIWLVPLSNLGIFISLGLLGCLATLAWPRQSLWLVHRFVCAIALLPPLLVSFPRIYTLGWLFVTAGVAAWLVPVLESRRKGCRRVIQFTLPVLLLVVGVLAASPWAIDRIRLARENARALPPPDSSNVLLIVLDTVAAGHLNLCGYDRPTSPTLVEVAARGIRFDTAQSGSSWTLPSHATLFTGRWMHELSVGWLNPLDGERPTLAGYLTARGYATAGFVANTMFCARDTGLNRGFTHYEDFIFPQSTALKSAVLAHRALAVFGKVLPIVEGRPSLAWLRPYVQTVWRSFVFDRKGAADVNRELLAWLRQRSQPQRPFFAFLNYSDAHTPYEILEGRMHRFGVSQPDERQRETIKSWAELDKARIAPQDLPFVIDAYDDCIADLDEQVGRLLDKLRRQGILDNTWLIIAADHGESFGEHAGVFCHGTSLYQTELHVPLVIVPPGGCSPNHVVKEPVSLRDLPATIVDVLGLNADAPFPGASKWGARARRSGTRARDQCRRLRPAQEGLAPGCPERRCLVVHSQ
jgi:arylsulfatase A-like enzyme